MALELVSLHNETYLEYINFDITHKLRTTKIAAVTFSPCGRFLVCTDDSKQLYVWRWEESKLVFTAASERGKFHDVCFLLDLDPLHFATCGDVICIWNLNLGSGKCRIVQKIENRSSALSLATVGNLIAYGSHDHEVRVWRQRDRGHRDEEIAFDLVANDSMKVSDSARCICFSSQTKVLSPQTGEEVSAYYIAACSDKGQIKIWALHQQTGTLIQSAPLLTFKANVISSLCFTGDAQQLIYSVSGFVTALDLAFITKKPGTLTLKATTGPFRPILGNRKFALARANEEQLVCVCANDHGLFLWVREGNQFTPITPLLTWGLAVHCPPQDSSRQEDPRFLCALGMISGEVRVWDVTDWEAPSGVETSKRKRVPRSYETKEDQEKEYEDRRIRKLQADHVEALKRSEGSRKRPAEDKQTSEDSEEAPLKRGGRTVAVVPPQPWDKLLPTEPKWTDFFEAAMNEGGLVPVDVPILTQKGFSKTEAQKALVF